MSKIVYLPLDERPCNLNYPIKLANSTDLSLVSPPLFILGNKKHPANFKQLEEWLIKEIQGAYYLILSIDMLIYGGIVPSRLHYLSFEECKHRMQLIRKLKEINPSIKIYAFNLIMRAPAYNSSEEEPDYYADYGRNIFRFGWLNDKKEYEPLSSAESIELETILENTPEEVLQDFIHRRNINASINKYAIEYVKNEWIDFLIIPLDDNSEYGFSPSEQRKLLYDIEDKNVMDCVYIYPGADEVGCTLFARIFCEIKEYRPEVYVRYSSTNGPFIIPKYEDRSLGESLKFHLTASGAYITDNSNDANFVLMVHSPPVGQKDVAETSIGVHQRHRKYYSEVNIREFVNTIRYYTEKGKMVALADVATCNGSDHSLMKLISKLGVLEQIACYAGWNTTGNTLGTVISHAIIESFYRTINQDDILDCLHKSKEFYISRLIEDWGYQSLVRHDINKNYLEQLGGSYFQISHIRSEVYELISKKLYDFINLYLNELSSEIHLGNVNLPWDRMFEVSFDLCITRSTE